MVVTSLWRSVRIGTLALLVAACAGGLAAPPSVAPEDGVTVENATGTTVEIVYEHVDDEIDPLVDLEPGASVVVGAMFEGVEAPCVNGRLIARDDREGEIDELYFVCRGKTWTVAPS